MEPVFAGKDLVPVYLPWFNFSNRAVGAIVDDFGWPLGSAGFEEKNSETFPSAQDEIGFDTILPNIVDASLPNLRWRHDRDHVCIQAEVGQANRRVRFRAGVGDLELAALDESLKSPGGKAH